MKNDSKGRDIFYGIIAIATLIVAIVGATLAYFSVSKSSELGAVNATSATISIEYDDSKQVTAQAEELIPVTETIMKTVYERNIKTLGTTATAATDNACIDAVGKEVCSAFRFSIRSDDPRTVTASLKTEHNGFNYLAYAVYDVTNQAWLKLNGNEESVGLTQCSNEEEGTPIADCYTMVETKKTYETRAINSIFGTTLDSETQLPVFTSLQVSNDTQIYDVVLFIKENNKEQNIDQGQKYSGTLVVDVVGLEGQITGKAD